MRGPIAAYKADYLDLDPVVVRTGPQSERKRLIVWFEINEQTYPVSINLEDARKLLEQLPEALEAHELLDGEFAPPEDDE